MKHIIALIQKIKDGEATAADVELLETMLEQEEDATLRQSLQEAFDRAVATGEQTLTPEKTASILMQLHNRMEAQEAHIPRLPVRSLRSRLLPYAAAVAGLIFLAGLVAMYYSNLQKGHNNAYVAQQHVKFIRNTTLKTVMITLPEGSLVTMEPGAALLYADSAVRNITLQGKAVFNVKANRNNPFTVYAGNTVTMALGTLFMVDAQHPQAVTVKLETGKVLVRTKDGTTKEDIYLLPGEEFHFDSALHQYSVAKAPTGAAHPVKGNAAGAAHAVLMAFNNAPLDSVLGKLETAFGINIRYEHSDVDGAYFTGQVLKTDSLRNILEVICQLNNLELTAGEGNMSIRKIR